MELPCKQRLWSFVKDVKITKNGKPEIGQVFQLRICVLD